MVMSVILGWVVSIPITLPSEVLNMAKEEGKLRIEIRSPYGESFEEQTASEIISFGQETESKIFPIAEAKQVTNSFRDLDLNKINLKSIYDGSPQTIPLLFVLCSQLLVGSHFRRSGSHLEHEFDPSSKENIARFIKIV